MTTISNLFNIRRPDGSIVHMPLEAIPEEYLRWDYWPEEKINGETCHFRFSFERVGDHFRIYIEDQPSYGERCSLLASTHRIRDGHRHYICIQAGNEPKTVGEAISWYTYWADKTVSYINTGKPFA